MAIIFADSGSSLLLRKESSDKGGLSANATAYAPARPSSKAQEKISSSTEPSEVSKSLKSQGTAQSASSRVRPSSSASSTSECGAVASASGGPGLSPSSSVGSLSSEKSTLNPNAKVTMFQSSCLPLSTVNLSRLRGIGNFSSFSFFLTLKISLSAFLLSLMYLLHSWYFTTLF